MTIRLKDRRKPWQKDLINFTVSLCGTVVRERVGKDLDRRRQLALPRKKMFNAHKKHTGCREISG